MKKLLLLILFSLLGNSSFAQNVYGILYLPPAASDHSEAFTVQNTQDLTAMVNRLNANLPAGADFVYRFVPVDTFTEAIAIKQDLSEAPTHLDKVVATVFHGGFDQVTGAYAKLVEDSDGWYPDDAIVPFLANPMFCNADGKVSISTIGEALVRTYGGQYGSTMYATPSGGAPSPTAPPSGPGSTAPTVIQLLTFWGHGGTIYDSLYGTGGGSVWFAPLVLPPSDWPMGVEYPGPTPLPSQPPPPPATSSNISYNSYSYNSSSMGGSYSFE